MGLTTGVYLSKLVTIREDLFERGIFKGGGLTEDLRYSPLNIILVITMRYFNQSATGLVAERCSYD